MLREGCVCAMCARYVCACLARGREAKRHPHCRRLHRRAQRAFSPETADSKLTKINWHVRCINPPDVLIAIVGDSTVATRLDRTDLQIILFFYVDIVIF